MKTKPFYNEADAEYLRYDDCLPHNNTTIGADKTALPFNDWLKYIGRYAKWVECKKLMEEINQGAATSNGAVNVSGRS